MHTKTLKGVRRSLKAALRERCTAMPPNLEWLHANLHPYFFLTMQHRQEAVVSLAAALHVLSTQERIILSDREEELILACWNVHGSIHRALRSLSERVICYAEFTHSTRPLPDSPHQLEIQRYEFGRRDHAEIANAPAPELPSSLQRRVATAMRRLYPDYDAADLPRSLGLLWLNNANYVQISPPERVARALWLLQQGKRHGGLYLDEEDTTDTTGAAESRVMFAVGNPPDKGFLAQVLEVFSRLQVSVRRAYCLDISTGIHPYFLGTFYVTDYNDRRVERDSELFRTLRTELYNTQILYDAGHVYTDFVRGGIMNGEDASLTNAMIAFSHTNLAHNQPDRFGLDEVRRALYASPDIALQLGKLFRTRFTPEFADRETRYAAELERTRELVEGYNTGHRRLDEVRRTVYRTALLFVRYTLKTNFFVPEKHALAFRLDPSYLQQLEPVFTDDLPAGEPFRITFFYGRHGAGYHIGFSDIARGGWRTIVCKTTDDFVTAADHLLREVYVLAHTQHLKNKDIYEGGSKMAVVLDAQSLHDPQLLTQRLYKLQYGFCNAFLDLFVTRDSLARHPNVVDYYREEEPIELGPDENMHDQMVEAIATLAERRGYVLGQGIMSSKRIGINHKEYGVTSLGVVRFAEIALGEQGIDSSRDGFTVKITGGTNGDVAGNALRLLLERCPGAAIRLVVAGTGALYDPAGLNRGELARLMLRANVDDFAPEMLSPGGFMLLRNQRKQDGLRELFRKLERDADGVQERWVTADDFHREFDDLLFSVPADLFLPCGGRPETIDDSNWQRFFDTAGTASCRIIAEGANSFITPAARDQLQQRGVVLIRDASANKCGVISSSYEIIANLLMSDAEFLERKETYVAQVLTILETRAEQEARLLFQRHRAAGGRSYTEISVELSNEINANYSRLFRFFQERYALVGKPLFRKVLLRHLPPLVSSDTTLRRRVKRLPAKIQCAILASELATSMVYRGDWETDLESALVHYAGQLLRGAEGS